MATFLLVIIYLAFISLGLPDSLLGVSWPVMQSELKAPLEMAGLFSMAIAGGTILSSLISGRMLKKFGTGKVTAVSVLMTAVALLGFYLAPSIVWLLIWTIPLGLGAGAVDAGLNDYVATHYKAHHMSWLHCFWGVGATSGPMIMAPFMTEEGWRNGYLTIAIIQFALVVVLFLTIPLWRRVKSNLPETDTHSQSIQEEHVTGVKPLQIKGVKLGMVSFLIYCAVEAMVGLWGSSYLVEVKGMEVATAARWVSLYYAGITVGRFLTGFITFKLSNRVLIRMGQTVAFVGAIVLILPLPSIFSMIGFIVIGLGLAPIYPCMLHETPTRFGKTHAQTIMGYQMAVAYIGATFVPPLVGFLASHTSMGIFPPFVFLFAAIMLFSSESLNRLLLKEGRLYI